MANAERVSDAVAFTDDMESFVLDYYGISGSRALIPLAKRNMHREDAEYSFSPEIGNALLKVLPEFSNMAESLIEYSNIMRLNNRESVLDVMSLHDAFFLTNEYFINDTYMWCSVLFDFLLKISSLCIHFGRNDLGYVVNIKIITAYVLGSAMDSLEPWKIDKLNRYARTLTNRPLRAQIIMYRGWTFGFNALHKRVNDF